MNVKISAPLAVVLTIVAHAASACNCALPVNYGNPACAAGITAALSGAKPASSPVLTASQQQTQQQAQQQSQQQTATGGQGGAGGNVSGSGNSTNTNTARSAATSAAAATATNQGNTTTIGGNTYEAARIPVATAFAAALTSAPCGVGSTSAGAQTPLLGVSFGTTRQNKKAQERCEKFDVLRVAFTISPLVGCYDALRVLPDIAAAMSAAGLTCEEVFAPAPVIPVGYLSPEAVEARVAEAVRTMTPPPCAKPASHAKRKRAPVTSCIMPGAAK